MNDRSGSGGVIDNLILSRLDRNSLEILRPNLSRLKMERGQVLVRSGGRVKKVWFPENGMISSVVRGDGNSGAEAGIIGYEGCTAAAVMYGTELSQTELMVQMTGEAWVVDAAPLLEFLDGNPDFRSLLLRYVGTLQVQTTQSLLAFAKAPTGKRLARWLLMMKDRARKPRLELTHEFLALMLGTRRAVVTLAIHELEGMLLIKAQRGLVTIADRDGLAAFAGIYYGVAEGEYARIMQVN